MGVKGLFKSSGDKRARLLPAIILLGLGMLVFGAIVAINLEKTNTYPIEFVRNFVDSCQQQGGTKSSCECSIRYLESNYTYEEVKRFDEQALENGNTTPDELFEGFNNCRQQGLSS